MYMLVHGPFGVVSKRLHVELVVVVGHTTVLAGVILTVVKVFRGIDCLAAASKEP